MQKSYKMPDSSTLAMQCAPDGDDDATEVVVFELVVPVAAKVPAPRQPVPAAALLVRQASITTTVPGKLFIQLRANNTALGAAWCSTATLTAQPARSASA